MARKKAGPTRLDLRRQAEAAEARDKDKDADEVEEVEEVEEADAGDDDGGDDEDSPKAKKAKVKAPAKPKKPAVKRTRAPKEVRQKAIWVVFDNSSKRLKEFAYNQKPQAEAFLAEKQEEKKGTCYITLVKEALDA